MSKKIFSLLYVLLTALTVSAQYTEANSFMRKAIVEYTMNNEGFYEKKEGRMPQRVDNVIKNYAYDVKGQNLYVKTINGNYVVTLTKEYAKIVKRNNDIPHLKGADIDEAVSRVNSELSLMFSSYNDKRQQHLTDSIAKVEAEARAKAKADSIARVKAEQERRRIEEEHIAKVNNYRAAHNWKYFPIGRTRLECTLCDHQVSYADSVLSLGVLNDTLYTISLESLPLDVRYMAIHKMPIPQSLKNDETFKLHLECFKDSLDAFGVNLEEDVELLNYSFHQEAVEKLKKEAPFGFFEDWEWNDEYSMLTFNFTYRNLASKTIKYIEVFFVVTNDVGDVRERGSFKGTGPVEQFHAGTWNWDSSHYFVSGDVTNMQLTKVIITYMDGSQKVLQKNMIKYE